MDKENEGKPSPKRRSNRPYKPIPEKERCINATNLTMEEAKAKVIEVSDISKAAKVHKDTRQSAQAPYFLNMIRELYREKDIQPKKLTPEVLEEVIERLWTGEALSAICQDDHIPAYKNLMKWMEIHPDVEAMIEKAKMRGTHALVDVAQDILNGGPMSTGDKLRDAELVKLIKWIISKRNHSYYGDQIKVTHQGDQHVFVLPTYVTDGVLIEDQSEPEAEGEPE